MELLIIGAGAMGGLFGALLAPHAAVSLLTTNQEHAAVMGGHGLTLVDLDGVPLVRRSVDALVAGGVTQVVVTIPDGLAAEFASALDGVAVPVRCIVGGETRQDSVRIGLAALATTGRREAGNLRQRLGLPLPATASSQPDGAGVPEYAE